MVRRSNAKTMLGALAAALIVHAVILPISVDWGSARSNAIEVGAIEEPAKDVEFPAPLGEVAAISLVDEAALGEFLPTRLGPFDSARFGDTHPLIAEADRSGVLAAHAGGELEGGPFRETTRRDHEDQREEIWNDDARGQRAFDATDRNKQTTSPEAVTRDPKVGFDSTTDRGARSRVPSKAPRPGESDQAGEIDSGGTPVPPRPWKDTDPILDNMVATARDRGRTGRVATRTQTAIADRGDRQADVPRRGRLVGALDSAAASDSKDPAPFELAAPGTGGKGTGAAGPSGPGTAKVGAGDGTASTTSRLRRGAAAEGVRATRGDPYFRALYRTLDKHVVFPRDLARALEQGTVIARFTLNPDGVVSAIKVAKTSGFPGFDKALVAALRKAGPFGKVPSRILAGGRKVRIVAPYRFSNPLIR